MKHKLLDINQDGEVIYKNNGVYLGKILMKEDGFYDFWPDHGPGTYWSGPILREIADFLEKKNKPWEDQIKNDLNI